MLKLLNGTFTLQKGMANIINIIPVAIIHISHSLVHWWIRVPISNVYLSVVSKMCLERTKATCIWKNTNDQSLISYFHSKQFWDHVIPVMKESFHTIAECQSNYCDKSIIKFKQYILQTNTIFHVKLVSCEFFRVSVKTNNGAIRQQTITWHYIDPSLSDRHGVGKHFCMRMRVLKSCYGWHWTGCRNNIVISVYVHKLQ